MNQGATAEAEAHWDAVEEAADWLEVGELDKARALLEVIESTQPHNEYAHYFLGNIAFEQGDHARALNHYVKALACKPDYHGALIASGHTLRVMGKYDTAIRVGQQALLQHPDDQDALFLLGLSCFARGDAADAAAYLVRFLATKPELEARLEAQGVLEAIGPSADQSTQQNENEGD